MSDKYLSSFLFSSIQTFQVFFALEAFRCCKAMCDTPSYFRWEVLSATSRSVLTRNVNCFVIVKPFLLFRTVIFNTRRNIGTFWIFASQDYLAEIAQFSGYDLVFPFLLYLLVDLFLTQPALTTIAILMNPKYMPVTELYLLKYRPINPNAKWILTVR